MSARTKLLLLFFIMSSVTIITLSSIGYLQFKSASIESSKYSLQQKSFLISRALEEKMNRLFDTLAVVSESINFTEKGEISDIYQVDSSLEFSDLLSKLDSIKQHFNVLNAYVGIKDGKTYAINNNGLIPNFNALEKKREWYTRVFNGEKKIITTPYLSASQNLVMAVAVPITKNGTILGVLSINLSLNEITEFVSNLDTSSKVYVSRNDGFVLAAKNKELIGTSIFDEIPEFKDFEKASDSIHSYQYKNNNYLVKAAISPELNWTVWAWEPWDSINSASDENLVVSSVLAILFIGLSLILTYFFVHRLMYLPIGGEPKEIEKLVRKVASGDLSNVIKLTGKETGIYAEVILMTESLRKVISDINQIAINLDESAIEILDSANVVNKRSLSQMQQLDHAVLSMNEMAMTVEDIAKNAVYAEQAADDAHSFVNTGTDTVNAMNVNMTSLVSSIKEVQGVISELSNETKSVGSILEVIKGISEQTNLLALNAAIEAARAGDSGRGFSVVADEVRVLATKTNESTNQIQGMIDSLQIAAEKSVNLMQINMTHALETGTKSEEAKQALLSINGSTVKIKDMNSSIATAAEEQAVVAQAINSSIDEINDLAKLTSENTEDNKALAKGVSNVSNNLKDSINNFIL